MQLGTIMGVWAHPDDETFMIGGILATAVDNGQRVACVTATKGEAGVVNEALWPADQLASIREQEMHAAMQALGVVDHHWLGYADGQCDQIDDATAIQNILALIEQYCPDSLITFPPDGLTGHPDHRCVSRWARAAAKRASQPPQVYFAVDTEERYQSCLRRLDEQLNIYFAIEKPVVIPAAECDIHVTLPPEITARKVAALKAMPSQTSRIFALVTDLECTDVFGTESLVTAEKDARWAGL